MNNTEYKAAIIILLFVVVTLVSYIVMPFIVKQESKIDNKAQSCEHEFVVTSRCTLAGYKVISKCIKCGCEV